MVVGSRPNGVTTYEKGFEDEETTLFVHPKYNYSDYAFPGYDVAIVELGGRIKFTEYDQPICIVDSFRENIGEVGYVVGYGYDSGQWRGA